MKKGFTLIELLAVIVILSIIMVIAVPMILSTVENAKKGAIESDAKLIIDAIEKRKAMDDMFTYLDITEDNIETRLGIKPNNYKKLEIKEADGRLSIVIEGQNKYDGYTAHGTLESMEVVASEEYSEPSEETTKTFQVSSGANDGYVEFMGTESFYDNYSYLWTGFLEGYRNAWVRWNNIDIPKDSTIISAKIQYKACSGDWSSLNNACETAIYFNNVGNAASPTNYTDFENKVLTTNTVYWNVVAPTPDTWIDSPDIKNIIQEIVDRSDWNSGNSMMLLHRRHSTNTTSSHARIFYTYESGANNSPKLVITYTP